MAYKLRENPGLGFLLVIYGLVMLAFLGGVIFAACQDSPQSSIQEKKVLLYGAYFFSALLLTEIPFISIFLSEKKPPKEPQKGVPMKKLLIVMIHLSVILYALTFIGYGDAVTFFSHGTLMNISPGISLFNIPVMLFALLQDKLFGGCFLTKLQAREERSREETERFLPDFIPPLLVPILIWIAIIRSAFPLATLMIEKVK